MDIEKLLKTADFARNPAHKEKLRLALFGRRNAERGAAWKKITELSDDELEWVTAAGTKASRGAFPPEKGVGDGKPDSEKFLT